MFKNVGREFFEWGKLICKTGIILSFTAKNGHGVTVSQKYYLTVYYFFLHWLTFCVQGNQALAKKLEVHRNYYSKKITCTSTSTLKNY